MNWASTTSFDHIWRSPSFPMLLMLAAAGFFGVIVLFTMLRAEKSVANGALTVITLLAVGIAVTSTLSGYGPVTRGAPNEGRPLPMAPPGLAALSCIDDLAGDVVQQACEKAVFGSAEFDCRCGELRGGNDHAPDGARRCHDRPAHHDTRDAGVAPGDRARPLRTGGAGPARARAMHADGVRGLSLADRQPPDHHQHGRASL